MADLIERLLAVEGGGDGTHWYRNPDGPEAAARIAELEAEVARLRLVIERDRTIVAMTLTEIRKAIGGRQWLSEGGRGSYAYDDEDYQKEFGEALDEIAAAMQPLRRLAADWQNCPTDPLDITIARKGLRESFRAALAAPDTGGEADGEWACQGGTRMHCHVFCTCDGSKAEEIDPRL